MTALLELLAPHIDKILDALTVGLIGIITLAFGLIGARIKRALGIAQDAALMEGMRSVERDHVAAKAVGAEVLPSERKEEAAIDAAAQHLKPAQRIGLRSRARKTIPVGLPIVRSDVAREFSSAPPPNPKTSN